MTYRDDAPSLRGECERLRAEVARLRAKRAPTPSRWPLALLMPDSFALLVAGTVASALCVMGALTVLIRYVADGVIYSGTPREQRVAIVAGLLALLWALAFVRRVPVEGSAR